MQQLEDTGQILDVPFGQAEETKTAAYSMDVNNGQGFLRINYDAADPDANAMVLNILEQVNSYNDLKRLG